jgi:hypothetical protein
MLVIDKNLEVIIAQQIEVYFISIIPDGHDKGTFLIEHIDLLV